MCIPQTGSFTRRFPGIAGSLPEALVESPVCTGPADPVMARPSSFMTHDKIRTQNKNLKTRPRKLMIPESLSGACPLTQRNDYYI
jgi:hypothetical protein